MIELVRRLPKSSVARESRLLRQDGRQQRQHRRDARARGDRDVVPGRGRVGGARRTTPCGVITSHRVPDARPTSFSQVDIRPPSTRAAATRSCARRARPPAGTGRSSTSAACPRPRSSPAASGAGPARRRTRRASSSGTANDTATASSVSRSTAETVRSWKRARWRGSSRASSRVGHQIALNSSKGSRQSLQRRRALQAVEPNRAISWVSRIRTAGRSTRRTAEPDARPGRAPPRPHGSPGGAMPALAQLVAARRRDIQSVVHAGVSCVCTVAVHPPRRAACSHPRARWRPWRGSRCTSG